MNGEKGDNERERGVGHDFFFSFLISFFSSGSSFLFVNRVFLEEIMKVYQAALAAAAAARASFRASEDEEAEATVTAQEAEAEAGEGEGEGRTSSAATTSEHVAAGTRGSAAAEACLC
jgi:hypothetical protein